ncbi:unnamed protein product [Caenorhabditis bovis]|uniref:T-box domain-containing protein n=1 Tax=Caenorhabditis bovis TaxID=2654633 RepID=A0A8S1EN29_9PELO|nr:unnamed protein product [Caenorhabditis bovis]
MEVKLCKSDLWRQFDEINNEMIITKRGRNMFPSLQFKVTGLDENALYQTSLTFAPLDEKKYRFMNGRWDQFEPCVEATHYPREVFSPETRTGKDLMRRGISFERLKITNGDDVCCPSRELVRLQSMRKYIPIVSIYSVSRNPMEPPIRLYQCQFNETKFIAVTAYQNTSVRDLKVSNNKYAQGFRENAQKRSSISPLSTTTSEDSLSPPNQKKPKMEPEAVLEVQEPPMGAHPHAFPMFDPSQQMFAPYFATYPNQFPVMTPNYTYDYFNPYNQWPSY